MQDDIQMQDTALDDVGSERIPVLYLAPWVDYGGTAKGTLDWFKWLDRSRFVPSLICTQSPSENRLLPEVARYAEEVWNLPELMAGAHMPRFIADFVHSRGVRVIHIMNSRLGFELLPDLVSLPRPPAIVVQLHVEEDTRGGYVRYVTTRYGNLVDAFSVTSRHLARAIVDDYDVSPAKCHVIYTGVDPDVEFAPELNDPVPGLHREVVNILFLGRITAQKDPLLMIDVVDALRRVRPGFQVHVVGYGDMEPVVRQEVRKRSLERWVAFHGATHRPARWLSGCDVLLMTSVFEGIPYVLFEAMAMQVPPVAPTLPGTVELMDDSCGRLVSPRDDVGAYVQHLAELIDHPALRARLGEEGRQRMRADYTLERMGREHGALYEALVARQSAVRPGMVT